MSNSYSRFRNKKGSKAYDNVVTGKVEKYGYGNGNGGANHYFMYYNDDDDDENENDNDTNSTAEERERELLHEEYMNNNNYDFPYSDERKLIT